MSLVTVLSCGYEVANWIAREEQAWVLYLSTGDDIDLTSNQSPVPFLSREDRERLLFNHELWLIYDNEEQALLVFRQVVGDDGPMPDNPYRGPHKVYAYLAGPRGGITENT